MKQHEKPAVDAKDEADAGLGPGAKHGVRHSSPASRLANNLIVEAIPSSDEAVTFGACSICSLFLLFKESGLVPSAFWHMHLSIRAADEQ